MIIRKKRGRNDVLIQPDDLRVRQKGQERETEIIALREYGGFEKMPLKNIGFERRRRSEKTVAP